MAMAPIIKPGDGLLYMKVGTHAQETLEDIIARKTREIENAGFALWGYGGNTCHPISMVQPFAREYERRGGVIFLFMQPMTSKHFALPVRAEEFSVDGINWQQIPAGINVLGSRYALAIKNLRRADFDLALKGTKVAIGNSMGRIGSRYVAGRVDKACLEVTEEAVIDSHGEPRVHIGLVAEIVDPYAVFVRNSG
jgi:hypothetical protein